MALIGYLQLSNTSFRIPLNDVYPVYGHEDEHNLVYVTIPASELPYGDYTDSQYIDNIYNYGDYQYTKAYRQSLGPQLFETIYSGFVFGSALEQRVCSGLVALNGYQTQFEGAAIFGEFYESNPENTWLMQGKASFQGTILTDVNLCIAIGLNWTGDHKALTFYIWQEGKSPSLAYVTCPKIYSYNYINDTRNIITIDNYTEYLGNIFPPEYNIAQGVSLTKPGPDSDDELASLLGYWTEGTVQLNRGESFTIEARILRSLNDREMDLPWTDISYNVLRMPGTALDIPLPLDPENPDYNRAVKAFTLSGNTVTIGEECDTATFTLIMSLNGVELTTEFPNVLRVRFNIPDNLGPYNPDGTTKPGQEGGDGLFDPNIFDRIESPDGSAEGPDGAGLYTRYLVSNATMHVFGDWLWTEDLGLAVAKAAVGLIYGSPADTLISLVSYPFSVGAVAGTGSANVKWGGFDTGITWPTLASNAGTINWGSISINKFWGNFLDYSPHTKIELYLPWGTGFVEIDTNQVMEGSISVKTNIEFAKGTCVHLVYNHRGSLIGSYSATVGKSLPITASDFASKQVAVAGAAIGLAVGATIAGASALNAGAEAAGGVTYHTINNQWGPGSRQYPVISGFSGEAARGEFARTLPNAARPALQAAAAAVRMPASYHRSGSFQEGSAGLGVQYPFIILSRPKQSMPQSYGHYYGYPCNKVLALGACFGYTEVAEVHLDGVPATDAELIEIDRLLKGGVLL